MNHDEHLDTLLDEALNEYSAAEPLAGMESRVLRRLQTPMPARASYWLRWGIAAAGVAAITLAIWIGITRRTPQTVPPAVEVSAQPKVVTPSQSPSIATKSPASASGNKQGRSRSPQLLQLATATPARNKATVEAFPVPVPLSADERAFATALNRHPEALRAAPAADNAPVIAQIEIKPLPTTDETPGEKQ
jgi:cytoskeletal protein RodZ